MTNNSLSYRDSIIQARKEVLINKDPKKALSIINNIEENSNSQERLFLKNTLALMYLESCDYKNAAKIYKEMDEKYQTGFCELLMGNETEAQILWNSAPDSGQCRWGICLLDFINLKKGQKPSYLQIRNHLEADMGYFIQAKKLRYAENLMKNDTLFISINLESYKLIGKVLLNYGFLNQARKYFLKSFDIIPSDAETLYFLGQYNYLIEAYKESRNILEQCLENNPEYVPAIKLFEKVRLKLNSIK